MFKTIRILSQETRTPIDTDGDGTPDRFEVDTDGDGTPDRIEFDPDQDGNIDRIAHLDEAGRWVQVDRDLDDDGTIDRITHYAFDDEDGTRRVTRREVDLDDDGTIDRSETYIYDDDGNRTRINFDLDDDGNIDRTARLNAEGRGERVELDVDDDGTIDRITHYAFDEDGNRRVTRREVDLDDDGTIDRSEAYIYDNAGNRTRINFDLDDDGNIDRTARLNAEGRGERVELDVDDDGTIDRITHFAFDEDGTRRVTRRDADLDDDGNIDRTIHLNAEGRGERVERDLDDDGTIDRITHYAFDEDGNRRVTRRDVDLDDDGNIDRTIHLNAEGRWERVEWDDDDDGTIDRTVHRNTDGSNTLNRTDFDDDGDGTTDRSEFYTQNADGNRDRANFDDDADGTIDRSETYTYDDDGNLSQTNFDDDNDGTTDRSEVDDDADGNIDRVNVTENRITAYRAPDADGDTLVYSLSGTDAALFTIDAATGEVSFMAAPDFEAPGDANGDNIYDIIVTASDGTTDTEQAVAITVTNENDNAPTFTSPATANARENQTAAYEAAATDADGDTLVYSLSGTDAALFTIDADTGEVSFIAAPDFEAPGDANGDNVYDIIVTASDGATDTEQAVAITVTSENGNIPVFTSPAAANAQENQTVAYMATATDADGDTLVYSLSGTDAALFTIDATTGEVSFMAAPDFEAPGDDGGDNVYDIIVTASDGSNSTNHNVAITVTDEYDLIPLSSLDGSNGFILNGIDLGDNSGISVSSAGDVNGDGYDDLIIGAYQADPNGGNSGETYVVYGGASAPGTGGRFNLSTLDGTNGFILNGIDAGDNSGFSVSSAGDVNGDGYDDLIIGAWRGDPNGDRSGETYVVYGGASAPGTGGRFNLSSLDGSTGFIVNGIDAFDYSGTSVSSAGDVNGDGYDDLIIGAWRAGSSSAGATYVVYGGASAPGTGGELDLSDLDGSNGFIFNGIDRNDYSGISVSSAGDVNGDGYDDLIIGAYGADPNGGFSGETYVVYGGASAPGTGGRFNLSTLDGSNGFILNGIDASDLSGRSVSSAGDVNGDGYDDLIIGARDADLNGDNEAGETYIVYGGASAPGTGGRFNLSMLNGTNGFILTGIDAGDQSGWSVSSAGDVNGDGYDDLIIGAQDADPNGNSSAGETYLVYGGASAPGTGGVLDLSDLDGTNGFILTGIDGADQSGRSVSSAGDVNGDGYDDLIIGVPFAAPNGNIRAGETYILYGGATGTESLTPVTAQGTAAADNFTGNAGDDSFTAIATDDVVRGGAGDDNISVTALDFAAINGGTGADRLVLNGAGLALDLTGAGHAGVDSVEMFDLSGTGANSLVLDAQAVFDVTEEREGNAASLDVLGDADDRVDLSGSSFALSGTATEDGVTYNVYRDGNAQLRIENGVQVQIPVTTTLPVFTSPATANAQENQTSAYMAAATDADGDTLVYSLSGTDSALFTINATTGEVSFIEAPDFEAPGDDDGDNVYDIIVTASDGTNSTNHNVAITVTDINELVPLSSLDGTNGFILNGIAAADQSGRSVSAGDVNGDGYDDLIISANNADPNGDNSGETYIVYGGASAPGTGGVLDLSRLALDGNGFTLAGIAAGDDSGVSASSAGDVNGDGYDDLIIGATGVGTVQGEYDMTPGPGEVYVVYGGATGADLVLDRSTLDGTRGFALTGIANGDMLGQSVSSAGDVNGDGYDDLIIGANGVGSEAGATYVVYGGASAPGTDGVLDLGALNGTNGFTLTGIAAGDQSGRSVSSAGDVNGDGYDDLIIGSRFADPNGDSSGETYIVYGGASAPGTNGVLDLSDLDGTNGFTLIGSDRNDRVGQSVSSAGDVNGDGYDDLIIGADGANGPDGENLAGEIHVVYGGASAPGAGGLLDLGALNGTNGFTLTGIDAYDRSGFSVSSAGDVNGDGYDDLIIGAANADPNGDSDAGETYIVYGGASAPGTDGVLDLSALDGTNGFILNGIDAYDNSGRSVSSAGDVNGDGYDDLIIGAYAADPDGDMNAGETYVVYGGATGTESLVPVTAQGIAAADNFTGNAGDDSFTAIAMNDVVRGGAGDDTIRITALDFAAIDGGTGADTLVLDGVGLALDLTGAGHASVDSVEVFDLSGTGANSLVLDALAVFDVTEEREGGAASLDVLGDADDRVELSGSNFVLTGTAAEDGVTYNVYRDGNAQLRVETGVQVVTVPVFTSPSAVSVAENQVAAYEAAATDDEGDALVYSLSGTDAALFTINAATGEVSFIAAPDFDMPGDDGGDNIYDIIVTASDGTNSTNHNVAIRVTNENDNIPIFTSPAAANAQENQSAAYMAAATDADGDTLVYSLSGTDSALFTIDADTGEVSFIEAPDFEAPGDDGGDNIYDIIVTASDGTTDTEQAVAITVTNDNDNIPVFTSPAAVSARENQTAAYMAAATDADGDTLVYSLSGTDAALFTIDANTGEVSFIAAPDFEAPGDDGGDNVYDITVTASDGTNRTDHNVAITVTNDNDNIPVFTSPATANAQENQTAAYMAAATDADGDTLVYSLSGTDGDLFTIDANTGEVSFRAAPDFEAPGDDGGDNVYDIIVTASDGATDTEQAVAITVTSDNDNVPTFTSPAAVSVAENQTAAYEAAATDADGDTLVYSLSGTDSALFTINAATGEVSFMAAPDFEAPGDDGGDNVYDIIVTASDGINSTDHNVAITVTNDNDNIPTFTSPATANAQENQTAAYMASATDADGDTLVYSLSGTDAALFMIDADTGEVSFMAAPDFEAPGDANGDNIYDIIVTASDGTTDTEQAVAITVTDINELVPLSSLDGTNGFILNGIDFGDQSGRTVSSAGDVNGDGYDDLIIGARRADPNGDSDAGETYIVYGGASAPGEDGVFDLSDLDGTNGFILNGIDASDYSGFSVSSAGDVNGDGYDDLIIGATGADPNSNYAGETYVIYGGASAPGTDGVLDLSMLDGTNGFILNGIDGYDYSGTSVSSAGDVNGDGYDDLIIGANGGTPNGVGNAGETYIVYGGANAPGTGGRFNLFTLNGTNGFTLTGIDAYDRSGVSVSSAGDVNGDGYDDLIIGAQYADPNRNSSGETYVIYGGASAPGTRGVLDLSDLDGTNGFILNGIDASDYSGFSVSSAGDVNGDGYDDLIIGANSADPNGDGNAGETYVVYGGANAPGTRGVLDLSDLDGTNGFILTGIDRDDLSGWSVSSAGDVNGDGYDDLIIGAYRADPNGNNSAGETYLVYGGASAPGIGGVLDLGALNGTNGFILTGIDADDRSGISVSSAGDVNGDGYDDLIIGASGADPNSSLSGETYVLYGGATGTESLTPVTASGTAAADNFTGNAGDDSFTAIAMNDVVRGGAGNDRISVTTLDFAAIDGGTGADRLVLDGAGLALDLTGPGNAGVDSVEVFDLSGTGANSLVLDALAVFDITEEREGGMASLDVLGDADDRVDLSGSSFALTGTAAEDGVTYNVYRDGNAEVRIENGVMVTLAAAGAQSAESKTGIRIDSVADPRTDTRTDTRTDPGTDPGSGTIRLDGALMNPDPLMNNDPWNNDLWNNDLWDGLWGDGVNSLDQPVHIDEDAILIPLSDPLSFGPLASGSLPGPWGDLIYWPGLESHPAMQNDLAMILPEMEIVTADMEGF